MTPTFAVCVATYGESYWRDLALDRAVASALGQGADEVLVCHDPGGERHGVRNDLARSAHSDWLVFLDADDHLAPGFVQALRAVAPTQKPALLNPAVGHWNEPEVHACFARKELELGNFMVIGTAVPRGLFNAVGGFRDWGLFEDWELWIRCVKAGAEIIQVPDAVYLIDSTEHSKQANASVTESGFWLREIRRHHWPEIYGHRRRAPRHGKRSVGG